MKSIDLSTSIQFLKGVGPALGNRLKKKGIYNVQDLLEFIPRTYEDQRLNLKISDLNPGETVKIKAQVLKTRKSNTSKRQTIYELIVGDSTGTLSCKFFRLPFHGYFNYFKPSMSVYITGSVSLYGGKKEFHHPDIEIIKSNPQLSSPGDSKKTNSQVTSPNLLKKARPQNSPPVDFENALIPIYSETAGLSQKKIRSLIDTAFKQLSLSETDIQFHSHELLCHDPLPDWLKDDLSLPHLKDSLRGVHYPELYKTFNYHEFKTPFHYRLIFDEFFEMELLCAYKKIHHKKIKVPPMDKKSPRLDLLISSLPFALTSAQDRVIQHILQDLSSNSPMNRLIQGDVGCGKTLVALCAVAFAIDHGYQVALMAPTEILAGQHFQNAQKFFGSLNPKHPIFCGFLSGSQKAQEKKDILSQLESGEISLVIGTHALIEESVKFNSLGLILVDEQHRFGVNQRNQLKSKAQVPHFLVMTATPIPRTLAMSLYGDLDVSIIDELPPGRSPIKTQRLFASQKSDLYSFVFSELKKGRQAYIVYPLVEESETLDLKNATDEFENLKLIFKDYELGLLHGRMKGEDKDSIMRDFKNNTINILVSTSVIEVGVDVPNATIMVIENSERFGLSQLHQLRGRVGRGSYESFCFLVLGNAVSEIAKQRANIIVKNTDGFKIAEYDLKIRGPGEFLGTKQSGCPLFKFAQLGQNTSLLELAREKAFEIFEEDPELKDPKNEKIFQWLEKKKYKLDLSEVG